MKKLSEVIDKVFIISNKLVTDKLISYLTEQGLSCQELRQQFIPEYKDYSSNYLALLNHENAWKEAIKYRCTLIVEEDFVPVKRFGALPVPFDLGDRNFGICWVYTQALGLKKACCG